MTHLYEIRMAEPPRIRATGLDAAHRIRRRLEETMVQALLDDPEVDVVEDRPYLREAVMPCDGTTRCRAGLHNHQCESRP